MLKTKKFNVVGAIKIIVLTIIAFVILNYGLIFAQDLYFAKDVESFKALEKTVAAEGLRLDAEKIEIQRLDQSLTEEAQSIQADKKAVRTDREMAKYNQRIDAYNLKYDALDLKIKTLDQDIKAYKESIVRLNALDKKVHSRWSLLPNFGGSH